MIGIYQIKNITTGCIYIGKSVNLERRISTHKYMLKNNKHYNYKIQNDWNHYGQDIFQFTILELCTYEEALKLEQYYLDTLKPEYNISLSSIAPMCGRKHSIDTINKFKQRPGIKGEKHYLYGKNPSPETIAKLKKSRQGRKHSEITKQKMKLTAQRKNRYSSLIPAIEKFKKPIIDSRGNRFESLTHAARFWEISIPTVCDILKGRHKYTRKKVSFRYE